MEIRLESTKYIGLAIGIIGIIALIFLLPQEKAFQIGTITQSNEGEKAILTGTIKDLSLSNGNAFFQIENNGSINAVYFSPKNEQIILLKENATIQARGKIALYKNELQIIISEVKKVD
ncbi:MAG TPA: OB-fold nucleic acid binding domain-containing protein [archaeon]|nr:OB-fold nucleic acid binding domain-containing protein [archaeon]